MTFVSVSSPVYCPSNLAGPWANAAPAAIMPSSRLSPSRCSIRCFPSSPVKIFGAQFYRGAVRGAVGGPVPGIVIMFEACRVGDALLGDQPFERGEPVLVIGVAGIGVARRLRPLDLRG